MSQQCPLTHFVELVSTLILCDISAYNFALTDSVHVTCTSFSYEVLPLAIVLPQGKSMLENHNNES